VKPFRDSAEIPGLAVVAVVVLVSVFGCSVMLAVLVWMVLR